MRSLSFNSLILIIPTNLRYESREERCLASNLYMLTVRIHTHFVSLGVLKNADITGGIFCFGEDQPPSGGGDSGDGFVRVRVGIQIDQDSISGGVGRSVSIREP